MKRRLVIVSVAICVAIVAVVILLNGRTSCSSHVADDTTTTNSEYRGINAVLNGEPTCEVMVDFGLVNGLNVATKNIRVTNNTETPILLVDYNTTCRCTWIDMPREAIQPGEHVDLSLNFDPRGEWGVVGNYINIVTSQPDVEIALWISAEIL